MKVRLAPRSLFSRLVLVLIGVMAGQAITIVTPIVFQQIIDEEILNPAGIDFGDVLTRAHEHKGAAFVEVLAGGAATVQSDVYAIGVVLYRLLTGAYPVRASDIDPITYEVVRHALWNVNEEHGATIQRLSGSPVAMYALDLNPSILTEDAEFVFFGPYMQYMSGVTDTQVKWTLEYRSDNPGIRPGDMFLANDPYNGGGTHLPDINVIAPVFIGKRIVAYVANIAHHADVGGMVPGSEAAVLALATELVARSRRRVNRQVRIPGKTVPRASSVLSWSCDGQSHILCCVASRCAPAPGLGKLHRPGRGTVESGRSAQSPRRGRCAGRVVWSV